MYDKFIADELAALRKVIQHATDRADAREARRDADLRRLLDDRERVKSEMIKVRHGQYINLSRSQDYTDTDNRRLHRLLFDDRVPVLFSGPIGIRAVDVRPIHGQPGLFRWDEWPNRILNSTDERVVGVAATALDQELGTDEWLVRVRITSCDPDTWDWHDWRRL